jgi:prepilin-type N-terminal cleavage/methylation domain-containing protein
MRLRRPQLGFSLLELLLVVLLVAIVATLAITGGSVDGATAISSAAQQVATDLAYCRSLAIANASRYEIVFVRAENRYTIRHSGPEPALHTLPPAPFRRSDDPANEHRVYLADIPSLGADVALFDVVNAATNATVTSLEFAPYGQTTASSPTRIWLSVGEGAQKLYLPITVDPTTGLGTIGSMQTTSPTGAGADESTNKVESTKAAEANQTGMISPGPVHARTS